MSAPSACPPGRAGSPGHRRAVADDRDQDDRVERRTPRSDAVRRRVVHLQAESEVEWYAASSRPPPAGGSLDSAASGGIARRHLLRGTASATRFSVASSNRRPRCPCGGRRSRPRRARGRRRRASRSTPTEGRVRWELMLGFRHCFRQREVELTRSKAACGRALAPAAGRLAMGAALGALGAVTVDAHGNAQPLDENLFADLPDSFVPPRAPSLHAAFLLQDGAGRCLKYAGRNRVTEMVDACAPADAALLWAYDPETRQVQLANDTVTCLDLFDVNSGGGREALGAYWCHGGPNQQFLPAYGGTGLCRTATASARASWHRAACGRRELGPPSRRARGAAERRRRLVRRRLATTRRAAPSGRPAASARSTRGSCTASAAARARAPSLGARATRANRARGPTPRGATSAERSRRATPTLATRRLTCRSTLSIRLDTVKTQSQCSFFSRSQPTSPSRSRRSRCRLYPARSNSYASGGSPVGRTPW